MIKNISIQPNQIKSNSQVSIRFSENENDFPLLSIDTDSYIVQGQIQSGINFDEIRISHNIQIGKFCSIADNVTFIVNLDHDYSSIIQRVPSFMHNVKVQPKHNVKGQILIQNDVWIGHGATIMSGVTISNGAIIGAESVVTKDVPPFAIVAGNPAKIVKYRFSENQINALNKISWWNWSNELLAQRKYDFTLDIQSFIDKYIDEAEESLARRIKLFEGSFNKPVVMFIPDIEESYSLFNYHIDSFFSNSLYLDYDVLIYLRPCLDEISASEKVIEALSNYENCECNVVLQYGAVENEEDLFVVADYYVTTRIKESILYSEYCFRNNVKMISGVDIPLFRALNS